MDFAILNTINYEDLLKYTDNFSDENYIGGFQFGKIYRGAMDYGANAFRDVTVKIWHTSSSVIRDNELRLMQEVILLRDERVRYQPAVVKLLGFVFDGEHVGVVYDFKALTTVCGQLNQDDFNWVRRIKVALWFARIVRFFHYKNPPHGPLVIHNIDANHILLDEDYAPKLFNFDLMTGEGLFPDEPKDETGTSCRKSGEHDDVFAFGRLLLSLISKKVINKEEAVESLIPQGSDWNPSEFNSLWHVTFEGEPYFYASDGEEVSKLAVQCMHSSPDERPSMKQVVRRLQKLQIVQSHGDLLEVKPKPPHPFWADNY